MPKFIRFDIYNSDEPECFGGHVYIDAEKIIGIADRQSVQVEADEQPKTIIHAGSIFGVRHPVMDVLRSIDSVLNPPKPVDSEGTKA